VPSRPQPKSATVTDASLYTRLTVFNGSVTMTIDSKVVQIRVHNNYNQPQPDTKSNPNPKPTTKQHAIVNIQLNIVA